MKANLVNRRGQIIHTFETSDLNDEVIIVGYRYFVHTLALGRGEMMFYERKAKVILALLPEEDRYGLVKENV